MGTQGGLPLLDGGQDRVRARPVQAASRSCQLQALHETSCAFFEAGPHPQHLAAVLAARLADLIGGGCIIRGRIDRAPSLPLACAHTSAGSLEALRQTFATSPHALAFACSAQATHTRRPVVLPLVSSEVLRLWTQPAAWPYLDQHQVRSLLVAPVHTARQVRATIVVWREHPCRPLTDVHALLLAEVASRIAPALPMLRQRRHVIRNG